MAIIAEVSWDDVAAGNFPQIENPARKAWRDAVAEVAERAKTALPDSHGRIDSAAKLVLNGDVELQPDGTAKVASQSNGATTYHIVNGECTCKDFPKAPANFCKHRLSLAIYKRASTLAKQRLEAQLDGTHDGQATVPPIEAPTPTVPIISPLPEAPASANVYLTIAGRKVQLTLRDYDEHALLARMEQILSRFPEEEPASTTPPPEGWCPIHHYQMKRYSNKTGSWWSHRLGNNEWCNGK